MFPIILDFENANKMKKKKKKKKDLNSAKDRLVHFSISFSRKHCTDNSGPWFGATKYFGF